MRRRRLRRNEFTVTLGDSEDRQVEITATYSAQTEPYWARDPGVMLPGDPEEIEVVSVRAVDEGADVAEVEAQTDRIEEAVREAANEAADWGEDDAADAEWERRKEASL
jgi:hypothetical protein